MEIFGKDFKLPRVFQYGNVEKMVRIGKLSEFFAKPGGVFEERRKISKN